MLSHEHHFFSVSILFRSDKLTGQDCTCSTLQGRRGNSQSQSLSELKFDETRKMKKLKSEEGELSGRGSGLKRSQAKPCSHRSETRVHDQGRLMVK